jgi:hypothetical protein
MLSEWVMKEGRDDLTVLTGISLRIGVTIPKYNRISGQGIIVIYIYIFKK